MLDAEKLQEMKDKNIISEEDLVQHKYRLAAKALSKEDAKSSVNGVVYIVLAFFIGTLGIHNFYARYWKRGLVQLFLTMIAQFALYIPLLFTALWAEMELLFVNRDAKGLVFKRKRKLIWLLRLGSVFVLVWSLMSVRTANIDAILQMMNEMYGVVEEHNFEDM